LVERLLDQYSPDRGVLLDPFAGSGTALFVASALGMRAEGIELLPVGQVVIETRQLIESEMTPEDVLRIKRWSKSKPWSDCGQTHPLNELRITKGAYPDETVKEMGRYLATVEQESPHVRIILRFALLCVLESISYTRKDGQYLRWDHRAGRRRGKKIFDKGTIFPFDKAIGDKLTQIVTDLQEGAVPADLFARPPSKLNIGLFPGSCLSILPTLRDASYGCIFTSPPYCNRYDYTRTYALELAMLGVNEPRLVQLRQEMLSCTVENRAKDLLALNPNWEPAVVAADEQPLLQALIAYLEAQKADDLLNNSGIPRMVRGYFYEMACVIAECARVLKTGARLLMVNDNVRYSGASVSVDVILSSLAKRLGFEVEQILVLPGGKGNSSQQMGVHGRDALRKCVYVWRKK
jgi:DNA modification methylase